MPQEFNMQNALKFAIQTEKNVMDLYKHAASIISNPRGKKVFEQLAAEEAEHVGHLFKFYSGMEHGSLADFLVSKPQVDLKTMRQLDQALAENAHERKAMELALNHEEELAKSLYLTASRIVDPSVRAVFERLAKETENHFALIESEYAHLMKMVHETDIDIFVRE
ncbi:MAG: ferritin [Deltaproteobacteria bacterium HGW-Deltaproteobacteria-4]|nr:MAG: ferritin [Deltaproteobacteria bacterium HGW-Deltaproteobacteria-4]